MVRGAYFVENWKEKIIDECKLRGYSSKTANGYVYFVGRFLYSDLSLEKFLLKLIDEGKSSSTVRTAGFAIKFYLRLIGAFDADKVPNVKRGKGLPVVLSRQEVERMIFVTTNLIHRTIIQLAYSSGLRLSEIINLRWSDVDFSRNLIHLKDCKGRKDRIVMLSPKVKKNLRGLRFDNRDLVFMSNRMKKYSPVAIQYIVSSAARKAGIDKKVTPHTLRHSFATHLLENGVDISYIQKFLGHSRVETTLGYAHIARKDFLRIKSPLD